MSEDPAWERWIESVQPGDPCEITHSPDLKPYFDGVRVRAIFRGFSGDPSDPIHGDTVTVQVGTGDIVIDIARISYPELPSGGGPTDPGCRVPSSTRGTVGEGWQ